MRIVLVESRQFTLEEISKLFSDAHVGASLRHQAEEEEEEEEEDTTIDLELMLFMAQREAFDRATGM